MRSPIQNGSSRSETALGMAVASSAAMRSLEVSPTSSRSISTFRAVPLLQRSCCKVFLRCSNGRTQAPLRLENCFDAAVVPGGSDRNVDAGDPEVGCHQALYFLTAPHD